jgi:hypothetical protein
MLVFSKLLGPPLLRPTRVVAGFSQGGGFQPVRSEQVAEKKT